jgi:hypothetical protein
VSGAAAGGGAVESLSGRGPEGDGEVEFYDAEAPRDGDGESYGAEAPRTTTATAMARWV